MYVEDALDTLNLGIGILKRWENEPARALRIFKLALKKAWKLRAFETHPDRNLGDATEFSRVNEAFDYLKEVDEAFLRDVISGLPERKRAKKQRSIYVEHRGGGKVKVTYISDHGISTSFVNYTLFGQDKEKIVAGLRSSGLMMSYDDSGRDYEFNIVEVT